MSTSRQTNNSKIKTFKEVLEIAKELKAQGKKIVSTNGCYDILHPGHIHTFEWAKGQGDVLIVGINSDASVRKVKGPKRPIVGEVARTLVLAGLSAIDYVFIFDEPSALPWLLALKPDVHVKGAGSEKSKAFEAERKAIEENGGEVRLAPFVEDHSTTNIVETIINRHR
jgi:rfaE bifunctional protein nucleotidyltransferase chain/domain